MDIQYPANQKHSNHNETGTIREGQTVSPHLARSSQTDLANFGVAITGNPEQFSYPCIGCDRAARCRENRACQMFMIWRTMSVLE